MQIFEIKNDTAEILYAPEENNLFLSDFLFIEDSYSTIVSQVSDISTTERADINIATVKFYLSVDKNNKLTQYDGHTPSKNSYVGFLDANEIIGLFKPKYNEFVWGQYARTENISVSTDLKVFSSGCAVICNREEQSVNIVNTMVNSFEKSNIRYLLLDFEGKYKNINSEKNLIFGQNYRIPLDNIALDYIFENDLNDCPIEARAIIQGIILAVQKYVNSSEDGFIPFDTFVNIIIAESKNSNNPELMIFGNKLLKYKQRQIFADKKNQFSAINQSGNSVKLDLSDIDEHFYPLIFKSIIHNVQKKFYVISDITDENTTPSTLKYIYEKQNIRLIPILNHDNKNLEKIKAKSNNFVIFSSLAKQKSEEPYSYLLEKLNNKDFILWGENTFFIPLLISPVFNNNKNSNSDYIGTDDITDEDLRNLDAVNIEAVKATLKAENVEIVQENADNTENQNNVIYEENEEMPQKEVLETAEKKNLTDNTPQEIIEERQTNIQPTENISPNVEKTHVQEKPAELKAKSVPDTEKQNVSRPMPNPDELKVYEPKENPNKTVISFEEGNRVSHAKYGVGTVEKIIKYGNKTLCSIQFDNLGRRLLDPNITIIEKL